MKSFISFFLLSNTLMAGIVGQSVKNQFIFLKMKIFKIIVENTQMVLVKIINIVLILQRKLEKILDIVDLSYL